MNEDDSKKSIEDISKDFDKAEKNREFNETRAINEARNDEEEKRQEEILRENSRKEDFFSKIDNKENTKEFGNQDSTDTDKEEKFLFEKDNQEKSLENKNEGDNDMSKKYKKTKLSAKERKELKKKAKKDKKANKKHKKLKMFLKIFFGIILILIIIAVAAVFAIFKTDRWAITEEQLTSNNGAKIYDKDGNELVTLTGDEINKKIELSDAGKLPDAFISIEDERFYKHKGVDAKRTAYAIFTYITSGGKSSFGGSTITQQLIKITMKDDDRTGLAGVQRKIREWSRAYQLEKMLTKDQILTRYLNRIYLGSANGLEIRGVESAANYYFNKSAKDLSIAECAFIAGINHSPSNYNPFTSTTDISDKIKTRTLTVLDKMHELGKISDDEYNSAKDEVNNGLKFSQGNVSNGKSSLSYHAAAAINQIANELADRDDIKYDEARELLINNGYSIYTTVDTSIQSKMEEVYKDKKYKYNGTRAKRPSENHEGQSAMVIIEPSTGHVVGEVGGLGDNQNTLSLNRALTSRQGGSAFKPLVTVAPGLENKVITASTLFYDTKTTFGNYTVNNDSSSYHGIESMRNLLAHSCNVPEVKLLSIMGINKSVDFLKSININVDGSNAGLSMALGTVDVSPLQMAAGYAMIANGGEYIEPTFYTKVTDASGNTIIEASQEKKRVMTEQNAYIEESLLTGPVKMGTAHSFNGFLGSMDVAGKTGTTETAGDRWFCGMTPYYAGACWYGNDQNNGEFRVGNPAMTVWFNVMKKVHQNLQTKTFNKPDGIVEVKICKATGRKATDKCTDTYTEIFSKDSIPPDCDGHTAAKICKESGKLATEFCPDVETKYFGGLIDTEKNATWTPKQSGSQAPTETCDIHTSAQKIAVPNVVGMTQENATSALLAAGFKVKVAKSDDTTKKKGIVLKQNETQASKGAEITITVNNYDGGTTTKQDNPTKPAETNTTKDTNTTKNTNTVKEPEETEGE